MARLIRLMNPLSMGGLTEERGKKKRGEERRGGKKMGENVKTMELFRGAGGAIVQNSYIDSDALDMRNAKVDGYFSLHMINTGGTVTVTVLVCSTKSGTFVAPNTAVTVISAQAAGTGFEPFGPPPTPFMKLRFTETNVAAVTAMDAWLNYQ